MLQLKALGSTAVFASLMCAFTIAATGCSGSGGGGGAKNNNDRVVPNRDESGCAISPSKGEKALFANAKKTQVVTTSYFNKKYDRADLEAVLTASADSTVKYIQGLLDGRLYKVPAAKDDNPEARSCPTFAQLPMVPKNLKADWWDKASGGVSEGQLAGLYFEDCAKGVCGYRPMIAPTILVGETRERWTLIHEMMHFNFDKERKTDPSQLMDYELFNYQASVRKLNLVDAMKQYQTSQAPADLENAAFQVEWFTRVLYKQTLVRSAFEEVSVEGTLLEEFLADRLKNVAVQSAANAIWYMKQNLAKGSGIFDEAMSDHNVELSGSLNQLIATLKNEADNQAQAATKKADAASVRRAEALQRLKNSQDAGEQPAAEQAAKDMQNAENEYDAETAKAADFSRISNSLAGDQTFIRDLVQTAQNKIDDANQRLHAKHPDAPVMGAGVLNATAGGIFLMKAGPELDQAIENFDHVEHMPAMRNFRAWQQL